MQFKSEDVLPKKFRLTKSEFQAVRKAGRLLSGRLLAILIHHPFPKAGLPAEKHATSRERIVHEVGEWQAKAGLIVSRRLSPKAVSRNRLKRRLRAALQRTLPDLSPGLHFVVLPNRRALDASVEELEREIRSVIPK